MPFFSSHVNGTHTSFAPERGVNAGLEDIAPAPGIHRPDRVERPGGAALDQGHEPLGEVAHVDHLDRSSVVPGTRTSPPRGTRTGQ